MRKAAPLAIVLFLTLSVQAQTWVDSVDRHGREQFMPAEKYKWDWGQATFLNSLIHLYQSKQTVAEKKIYLDYVKTAMDATYAVANGKHPNAVASAHGMAFLARITGEKKYLDNLHRNDFGGGPGFWADRRWFVEKPEYAWFQGSRR